jgi:hypothetical protein
MRMVYLYLFKSFNQKRTEYNVPLIIFLKKNPKNFTYNKYECVKGVKFSKMAIASRRKCSLYANLNNSNVIFGGLNRK